MPEPFLITTAISYPNGRPHIGHAYEAIAGDVIACPPGGPETAHQIINTSDAELKIFAVSTQISPEVCEYPETGRFGLIAEMPSSVDGKARDLRFVGRTTDSLEYWQGE